MKTGFNEEIEYEEHSNMSTPEEMHCASSQYLWYGELGAIISTKIDRSTQKITAAMEKLLKADGKLPQLTLYFPI